MSGEKLSGDLSQATTEWDSLTNAEKFRAEKAKREAEAVDPEELAYYLEHPENLEQLSGKKDPDERKDEADWYRAHPDKIANLILAKDQRVKAEKEAKLAAELEEEIKNEEEGKEQTEDEDFGQSIRDVLDELEEETKNKEEEKEDGDFGESIREILAELEEDETNSEEKAKIEEEEKAKIEEEEKAKIEEEEKVKIEEEEKAKLEAEAETELETGSEDKENNTPEQMDEEVKKIQQNIENAEAELARRRAEREKFDPLVGLNADVTEDRKDMAHDFAEQQLNAEIANTKGVKGFVSRIWKGNLFKKYYQKKYEREILEGERLVSENGEKMSIDDAVKSRERAAIERMVMGTVDEYGAMVHKNAGEELEEADEETTTAVKEIITWFAGAEIPEGQNLEDLRREFSNRINRLKAERRDEGKNTNEMLLDNYCNVAMQARERVAHGIAIEQVMEGFKLYNAKVRDGVRTEAHRDKIDSIVDKLESSKVGQFIPAEVIAAAVGAAYSLTQTGARAIAGAGLGIGVSGVFAGLRERNRVTEDRTRKMRDAAMGGEYVEDGEDRISKKRAKYEARIGGTLYETVPASHLTENLEAAIEGGDPDRLLEAIAAARVCVDFSDSEGKDLIAYSSPDKIGDERLALDLALIKAERSLPEDKREVLAERKELWKGQVETVVEEQDEEFVKLRRKLAFKAAAKTVAIGAATFFASQELMAAFDPNKIGVFEKMGILKTENAENAQETLLASGFGLMRGSTTETISDISGEDAALRQQYKDAGFTEVEKVPAHTEIKTDVVGVTPAEAATQKFAYDGWANNGTRVSDGNELRAYLEHGQFRSGMFGESTFNGQRLNYSELAAAGRVKGYLTIGGRKFELQGAMGPNGLTWGENGVFTTATGETIKAIGDNGEKLYKYFEIALDNGVDSEGISHIIPFATDVGRDSFDGMIQKATEVVIEHPAIYDYVKSIPRTVFTSGVVIPNVSRIGLGEVNFRKGEEPIIENPEIRQGATLAPGPEIAA